MLFKFEYTHFFNYYFTQSTLFLFAKLVLFKRLVSFQKYKFLRVKSLDEINSSNKAIPYIITGHRDWGGKKKQTTSKPSEPRDFERSFTVHPTSHHFSIRHPHPINLPAILTFPCTHITFIFFSTPFYNLFFIIFVLVVLVIHPNTISFVPLSLCLGLFSFHLPL